MDLRRLLLAALLSLAVLLAWQWMFPPPAPSTSEPVELVDPIERNAVGKTPVEETSDEEALAEESVANDSSAADSRPAGTTATNPAELATDVGSASEVPDYPVRMAETERVVVLENGTRRAEFTNRGAILQHYVLLDQQETGGGELDLVRRREGGLWPFALVEGSVASEINQGLFVVEQGSDWAKFEYADGGVRVFKSWRLLDNGAFDFEIEVDGLEDWAWHFGPGVRNAPPSENLSRIMRRNAVYLSGGDVETIAARSADATVSVPAAALSWFGIEDNYFLAAAVAPTMTGEVRWVPFRATAEEGGIGTWVSPGPVFEAADKATTEWGVWVFPASEAWSGEVYLGDKAIDELKQVAPRLDDTVHTGFLKILARPLHAALRWIHNNIVANYGWSIVLLTVLVRLLLFPLTHKSAVSMRKMQALNPRIQAIRQKYRPKLKDKQGRPNVEMQRKMNEEVMAVYKGEGVNPAGGCLPMLLQLPVFIAFYSMLPVAVELRNAPWLGWIQDLSVPDPFYVLPIVMGVSQLAFQRLMPSTGDKTQQRIMMVMPIFFTFLFLKFAAGLVLYWLTSNLLGIGQQLITNRLLGPPAAATQPERKKGKRNE